MNQKGIAQLLIMILLVIGIGVGVYLLQFTQIFKPKATGPDPSPIVTKYGSTPISDLDKYPKPQNHVQITAFLVPVSNTDLPYMEKEFNYWFEGGDGSKKAGDPPDLDAYLNSFERFKSINPNLKTAMGVRAGYVVNNTWPWPLITDQDILHNPDGSPVIWNNETNSRLLNLSKAEVRDKMATALVANLNQKNIDAIIFDYWDPTIFANTLLAGKTCLEPNCKELSFWTDAMKLYKQKIKSLVPIKEFFGVAYPDPNDPTDLDGFFHEHAETYLTDSAFLKADLTKIDQVSAKGKKTFMFIQPRFLCTENFLCNDNTVPVGNQRKPIDLELQRYYLTAYLLIQNNPYTYFGYYPGAIYNGNNEGLYFYKDWNQDYGAPLGKWTEQGPDYYARSYANGFAILNASNQNQLFQVPAGKTFREWDPITGPAVINTVTIPPKTGKFFFKPQPLLASYELLNLPSSWSAGGTQQFQVKVTNLGTTTWVKGDPAIPSGRFELAAYIGPDSEWTHSQTAKLTMLSADLPPGQSETINVMLNTPPTPGNYSLYIRMVQQGYTWFDPAFQTSITTVESTASPLPPHSPSPSPSSSIPASPSAAKPGDTDNDGDVDIFDFNNLVTDFGKKNDPNTKADLDNDDDVDIFDFNILVTNFNR